MSDLINVLTYSLAVVSVVAVVLGLLWWWQAHRNDRLVDELSHLQDALDEAVRARNAALYRVGRLERRLARMERDDVARSRRGYIDMPTRINGSRI